MNQHYNRLNRYIESLNDNKLTEFISVLMHIDIDIVNIINRERDRYLTLKPS